MNMIELARQMRPLIVKAAQNLEDSDAVKAVALYDEWSGNGIEYKQGYKVRRNGKVYKVLTPHTSQSNWTPETAASLFTVINEVHAGTYEDPIPYTGNMEIFVGRYYIQDDIVYLCNRDSGTALHNALKDLIGVYVEAVE